jgi:uncharacterized protein (TIGR03435 family)
MFRTQIVWLVWAAAALCGQTKFDVSTIRPSSPDARQSFSTLPGGQIEISGASLAAMVVELFDVQPFQIAGGPSWMQTERWDIRARAEGVTGRLTLEQLRPMARALLEERFQLKSHWESKEAPIFALVVARGGAKLKASPPESQGPYVRAGRNTLDFGRADMALLIGQLGRRAGRKVVDQTGLRGQFDFRLEWTPLDVAQPDAAPNLASGPDIFTAIREQLGLSLEPGRGPVETLVIDAVQRPTEN